MPASGCGPVMFHEFVGFLCLQNCIPCRNELKIAFNMNFSNQRLQIMFQSSCRRAISI